MYECPKCSKEFDSHGKLGRHTQLKHSATKVKCDWCGKEFKRKPSHIREHNFCSQMCYAEWRSQQKEMNIKNLPEPSEIRGKDNPNWKEKIIKICEYCGEKFEVKPSLDEITRFCSRECIDNWKRETGYLRGDKHPSYKERVIKICKECGKKFKIMPSAKEKAKFCSRECQNNWKRGRELPEEIKQKMKGPRPSSQGSNHPNWKGGASFEPYPPEFNERLKEKVRKRDNRTCQMCGTTANGRRKMCVHHIDGNKENCSLENLVTLCTSCNRRLENFGVRPQFNLQEKEVRR